MAERLDWHRIFGLMLTDYFDGSGYTVEMEMDIALKRQMLDVVVVQRGESARLDEACDGFKSPLKLRLFEEAVHFPLIQ